jgi:predicted O-methyltransferase YrrM
MSSKGDMAAELELQRVSSEAPSSPLWCARGHFNAHQSDYVASLCSALRPRNVLETGFCTGRSALAVMLAASPDRMVSIDVNLDYMKEGRAAASRLQEAFPALRVIEADSSALLSSEAFWAENFPDGIDWFTVDGDHSYEGCTQDLEFGLSHLRPLGVLLVDDYRSDKPDGHPLPEVTRAVDAFVERHRDALLPPITWNHRGKGFCVLRRKAAE